MRTLLHFMDWPLRAKMAVLLVVASILPLGVATLINIREARQRLVANTADLLAARADHLADQLDIFHRGYQRAVDRVAHLPNVVEFCQTRSDRTNQIKSSVRTVLDVWPASDSNVRGLAILDLSGTVQIGTEAQLIGMNLSYHSYVQEALRGGAVISNIHLAEPQVGASPTIAYLAPVVGSDRKLVGIAVLWIRATALWDVMKASNELAGPSSFAVLFDHQGIRIGHTYSEDIVFHPGGRLDPATINALVAERRFGEKTRALLEDVRAFPEQFDRALAKSPDEAVFRGFAPVNQKWNYGVARRFETVPWTIFYMIPEEFLNAQIATMTRQKTLFAGVIILIALLAGSLFAAFILKPIRALSTATKLIAGGDLAARVRRGHADEFGRLGTGFNSMAEQIEAQATDLMNARDEMEVRVQQRTAELARANESMRMSEARMGGIVNSAMDAIISVDSTQRIVLFNAAAEKMFRCSAAKAMGQSLDMCIPERFREQHHGHVEGFGKTGVTSRSMRSLGTLSGLRTDGEEFPIEASISQVEVGGENIFTVILRDVTDRNRAEEKFRLAVESAPNAVVISDREGHIVLVNKQAEKLFGYTRAELLAESVEVLVPERFRHGHPDYRSGFHSNPAVRSMGVGRDLRARRKDGSEFPVEIGLTPIHTGEGLMVLSAIVDISERRRSEKKFQLAVESAPNGVVMVNSDGRIVLVNAQTERLFGYERAELMGQPVEILVPERYRGQHPAYRDKFLGDPAVRSMGAGRDLYGLRKDGSEFPVEIGLTPIQTEEENLVMSAIVDITERKRAESALRASEDQFRTMANSIPQLAWVAHADGFIFWYNQRWHDYTGKTPEQMEGWGWQSVHDPDVLPKVMERWQDAIASGQPLEMEFPLRGADGKYRMFLTRVQPLKDSQGSVVQWFGTNTDVDELKRMEESLRDTQSRLNSTLAAGSIGTWSWDIVNDRLVADEFTARMFSIEAEAAAKGLPAEEYLQVIDEEDRPGVADALARAIQSCGQYDIEYRVRQKEGEFRWLQARGRVEGDEAGNAVNFHGAVMDITERKQAAAAVRESAERFRAYVEQASDSIFVHDFSGRFLEVNRQACASLGYSREELLRMSVFDVETDFDLPKAQVVWGQIQPDQASTIVGNQRRKDGSQFPVEVRFGCFDMGGKRRYLGLVRDVTERKLAEQEIRALNADLERRVEERTAALYASEARYRLLFDSIDEGFCIIEMIFDDQEKPVDYRFLEVNPSFERLTGLRDAVGKRMREFAPQHEEHWFETYGRIAVTGETTRFQNHAKELERWYDVYACRFGEPKNQQVAIVFSDITERKAAEANIAQLNAELQQRAAELNSLFESLPGLYLVLTPELKIVAASDAYLKATMTTREGILGRNLFEVFPDNPDDPGTTSVANMQASIDRVFRSAAPDIMAIQKQDVRRPDGVFEERYWSPINSPMFGADHQITYIIHRVEEVTEFVRQKPQPSGSTGELNARVQQMEAEVFQSSQRLQAANQQLEAANKELEAFSYSVSHDLRAPLRHINGFSQALLEDYEDKLDDAGKNYLHQVRGASQEMAQLIDDVLQLARVTRAEMRREPINLSEVARKVITDLRKGDEARSVVVEIEEGLATQGDKRLMQVMLINLLGNAWKFTSKREQAEIAFGQAKQNGRSVYFVRDNGAGFDMAYVGKLFSAFQRLHTTSEFEGTGIGLATVQRIVHRHGGRVWTEGALNQGATFYFTLPDSKELDNGDQSDPAS